MNKPIPFVALLTSIALTSSAASILFPFTGSGNAYVWEPFALNELNETSCRYQQVYDAGRFLAVLPDGLTITQLVFAVDSEFPRGFNTIFPDIQIDLSVTDRSSDLLCSTFADNRGTNIVSVFPRGSLGMVSSGLVGTPIVINLVVPFVYHPNEGNLLLDVRIFTPNPRPNPSGNPGVFEAQDTLGDSISRVYSYDVSSPTGVVDTVGLVTVFRVIPPPTPRLRFFGSFASHETNLVVRWFRVPGNYTLQQSPVLGSGASWQPYGGTVYSYEEYFETRVPVNQNDTARFFRLVSQTSTNFAGHQPDNGPVAVPFLEP